MPWLSRFPETNVRTYVTDREGRRGVWFFSLDAARWAAVIGARLGFGLPYFRARMKVSATGETAVYSSRRLAGPAAMSRIAIAIGEPIGTQTKMEIFLTARFRLFAKRFGRLILSEIRHERWPLQRASILDLRQSLIEAAGLPGPDSTPVVHFARRVDVLVGAPRMVSSG